jgi:hypothetical protein
MTIQQTHILIYGRDLSMLQSRQRVLSALGYKVWVATALAEIRRIVSSVERLDLLVLCHSFSREEDGRAITLTHSRWPLMRSCVLRSEDTSPPVVTIGEVREALEGPAKLGLMLEKLVVKESSPCSHLY